ncbi:MAG: porin family protein [Leptospirales bacterium]|nr:porin family protein [Leptospirales bacterium]
MKNKIILCLIIITLPFCAWAKSKDKVFVNGFTADTATAGIKTTADNIFKNAFLDSDYRITDINAISAGLSVEELKMTLGSNDENSLKHIMASGDVDHIAYGYIRARGGYIFITAKMLDKSGSEIKLGRVKTVSIRNEISKNFFEEACALLAEYLITGNTKKILQFQDKMLVEEKRYEIAQKQKLLTQQDQSEYEKYQKKVDDYKRKRKETITGHDTFLRVAYNPYTIKTDNKEFNNSFKEGRQFFVELDIPLFTETVGLDIIARYTARYFPKNREFPLPASFDKKLSRDWERGKSVFDAFDFGLRIRFNFYFLMTEFDIYGIGALGVNERSFSAFGGGGVEISFFPHIGFFAEYNRGWSSIGEQNINVANNHQLLIGTAFRL